MSRATQRPLSGAFLLRTTGLLAIGLACNQGPARSALAEVEASIAPARGELERYVPDQLTSLEAELADAHTRLKEGHYTDALRTAQRLPPRVAAALAAAGVRRQEFLAAWSPFAAELPARLAALDARLTELAVAKALPRGLDPENLAAARVEAANVARGWAAAEQIFAAGDVPRALRAAHDVGERAQALAARLGVSTVVVASPPRPGSVSPVVLPAH